MPIVTHAPPKCCRATTPHNVRRARGRPGERNQLQCLFARAIRKSAPTLSTKNKKSAEIEQKIGTCWNSWLWRWYNLSQTDALRTTKVVACRNHDMRYACTDSWRSFTQSAPTINARSNLHPHTLMSTVYICCSGNFLSYFLSFDSKWMQDSFVRMQFQFDWIFVCATSGMHGWSLQKRWINKSALMRDGTLPPQASLRPYTNIYQWRTCVNRT